ncbi:MAG: hypothetical protein DBY45_04855 [Clostridiales bacterium]|nr:MAG: hypothetical protein DBY45_04855 [Clostridiales bacterium]
MDELEKKRRILIGVCLVLVIGLLFYYFIFIHKSRAQYIAYCSQINEILNEEEFFVASVWSNPLELNDRHFSIIKKIEFPNFDKHYRIYGISKDENKNIYFALGGAVDDNWGILFINDPSVNLHFDGIDWIKGEKYHLTNSNRNEVIQGNKGPRSYLSDVQQLERLGPNVYSYSTMTPK